MLNRYQFEISGIVFHIRGYRPYSHLEYRPRQIDDACPMQGRVSQAGTGVPGRDGCPRDGRPSDGCSSDGCSRDGCPRDGRHRDGRPRDGVPVNPGSR